MNTEAIVRTLAIAPGPLDGSHVECASGVTTSFTPAQLCSLHPSLHPCVLCMLMCTTWS